MPEVLAVLPPSPDLPPPPAWAIHSAVWSSTGIAVFGVGPARAAPVAMVKIPSTGDGAASQRREAEAVAAIRSDERAGDWLDLVPVRLAEGTVDGRSYLVESAVPGVPATRLLAGGAGAGAVLQTAASCIAILHRRTGTQTSVDQARLHRWVDEPLTAVRSLTGNAAALQRAGDELHAALRDRPAAAGWVHGNYTPGNVVMDPDTGDVRGVIDWDWAAADDLGVLDVAHLLVSANGETSGRELGDLVASGLRGEAWCGDLRELLEPSLATSLPGEPPPDRVLLLLFWLRHVTANLLQRPEYYRRNWVWKRRNVEAVLRAF